MSGEVVVDSHPETPGHVVVEQYEEDLDDSSLEMLEIQQAKNPNNFTLIEDDILESTEISVEKEKNDPEKHTPQLIEDDLLEVISTPVENEANAKTALKHSNEIVTIADEEDILEYTSPAPPSPTKFYDNVTNDNFLSIPIILHTGSFPYLLAPLANGSSTKLPEEYEDAIILFDEGIALETTIYEIFEQIRKTFKELENPFKEESDLVLNFKEFELSLNESSVYCHQVMLSEIISAFETLVMNTLDDPPSCLHLELTAEKSFLTRFDEIRGVSAKGRDNIVNAVSLESDEETSQIVETVDSQVYEETGDLFTSTTVEEDVIGENMKEGAEESPPIGTEKSSSAVPIKQDMMDNISSEDAQEEAVIATQLEDVIDDDVVHGNESSNVGGEIFDEDGEPKDTHTETFETSFAISKDPASESTETSEVLDESIGVEPGDPIKLSTDPSSENEPGHNKRALEEDEEVVVSGETDAKRHR